MVNSKTFDVIIVGGSYAGLSAAMSLGRALRQVLIIDSGQPCNRQTPHSHNFITHDGETPAQISALAREQVARYSTVTFYNGLAISAVKTEKRFSLTTQSGNTFSSKKLVFATGLKDIMPDLPGFAECWGISILHCPYCHGYEVKNLKTGLLGNGDTGFELVKLISNWTKDIVLFTNGKSTLTIEQTAKLEKRNIPIIQTEIQSFQHDQGKIRSVVLKDQTEILVNAMYARPVFVQHCPIPVELGCEVTEPGFLKVDGFQRTTVAGVYACGDNSIFGRAVSLAVASGTATGAFVNKDLMEEEF
ncbi:pyridine nucleotide-disulfide oxidoreductase [Adhaeribacter arboris]|uniref:Pyridine nucleotide-disulfide oxidoreductase n=1 Tax=Adhaeribacter arboris TaxID=2072846 RepID=A0A2T2YIN8_9BACT|nr:NAD(P)/FAD-dependent oxidoreductase [Adhaeribacter arboris]PSR55370.1 pyridine nucleotide-disulfide oxidoreductase [Adhaeribacter arboris]